MLAYIIVVRLWGPKLFVLLVISKVPFTNLFHTDDKTTLPQDSYHWRINIWQPWRYWKAASFKWTLFLSSMKFFQAILQCSIADIRWFDSSKAEPDNIPSRSQNTGLIFDKLLMWLLSVQEWMNQRVNTLVDGENSTRDYDGDSFLWIRMTYQYGMTYAIPTRNRIMCRQLTKAAGYLRVAFFSYSILWLLLLFAYFNLMREVPAMTSVFIRWTFIITRNAVCHTETVK